MLWWGHCWSCGTEHSCAPPPPRTPYSLARGWQGDSCFFFPFRLGSEPCIGTGLDHLAWKASECSLYKLLSNTKAKCRVHPRGLCFFPCIQGLIPWVELSSLPKCPCKLSLAKPTEKKQKFKASQSSRVTLSHRTVRSS